MKAAYVHNPDPHSYSIAECEIILSIPGSKNVMATQTLCLCMQWDEKQACGLCCFFHYNLNELTCQSYGSSNSFLPLASQNSIVPKIVFEKNGGLEQGKGLGICFVHDV